MNNSPFTTEQVHKDVIRPDDIIVFHGKEVNVGSKDIKEDPFMGRTIFGDSFQIGYQSVTRLKYRAPGFTK